MAASLEHAILLQYLFTAWTLKRRPDEGLDPRDTNGCCAPGARRCCASPTRRVIHLGIIVNLLNCAGRRPRCCTGLNFPQAIARDPFDLSLTRWDDHTLWRYVRMELPQGEPLPPEPENLRRGAVPGSVIEFDYLGELYDIIRAGLRPPGEEALIVPTGVDEDTRWGLQVRPIPAVTDLSVGPGRAGPGRRAGRGRSENREDSHFERFSRLRREFADLPKGFVPTRNVVDNPRTWATTWTPCVGDPYIENETTRWVARRRQRRLPDPAAAHAPDVRLRRPARGRPADARSTATWSRRRAKRGYVVVPARPSPRS